MSDELLNRNSAPSELELEEKNPLYDEDTIRAMIQVAGDAFDFERVGKMLAKHEPRMFLQMLQKRPEKFTPANFAGMTKVEGIKYIRSCNNMGLREAKDLIERIGGYMDLNGNTVFANTNSPFEG